MVSASSNKNHTLKIKIMGLALIMILLICGILHNAHAADAVDFYAEVMKISGTVTLSNEVVDQKPLREGQLVHKGDVIQTEDRSFVDISFDRDWKNIIRIGERSSVRIDHIHPTTVMIHDGHVTAKLDQLPKKSRFVLQSPTAIAAVRGTTYRMSYLNGQTDVITYTGQVAVSSLDTKGQPSKQFVLVTESQKTYVDKNRLINIPIKIVDSQIKIGDDFIQQIRTNRVRMLVQGKKANLMTIEAIEFQLDQMDIDDPLLGIIDGAFIDADSGTQSTSANEAVSGEEVVTGSLDKDEDGAMTTHEDLDKQESGNNDTEGAGGILITTKIPANAAPGEASDDTNGTASSDEKDKTDRSSTQSDDHDQGSAHHPDDDDDDDDGDGNTSRGLTNAHEGVKTNDSSDIASASAGIPSESAPNNAAGTATVAGTSEGLSAKGGSAHSGEVSSGGGSDGLTESDLMVTTSGADGVTGAAGATLQGSPAASSPGQIKPAGARQDNPKLTNDINEVTARAQAEAAKELSYLVSSFESQKAEIAKNTYQEYINKSKIISEELTQKKNEVQSEVYAHYKQQYTVIEQDYSQAVQDTSKKVYDSYLENHQEVTERQKQEKQEALAQVYNNYTSQYYQAGQNLNKSYEDLNRKMQKTYEKYAKNRRNAASNQEKWALDAQYTEYTKLAQTEQNETTKSYLAEKAELTQSYQTNAAAVDASLQNKHDEERNKIKENYYTAYQKATAEALDKFKKSYETITGSYATEKTAKLNNLTKEYDKKKQALYNEFESHKTSKEAKLKQDFENKKQAVVANSAKKKEMQIDKLVQNHQNALQTLNDKYENKKSALDKQAQKQEELDRRRAAKWERAEMKVDERFENKQSGDRRMRRGRTPIDNAGVSDEETDPYKDMTQRQKLMAALKNISKNLEDREEIRAEELNN